MKVQEEYRARQASVPTLRELLKVHSVIANTPGLSTSVRIDALRFMHALELAVEHCTGTLCGMQPVYHRFATNNEQRRHGATHVTLFSINEEAAMDSVSPDVPAADPAAG